MKVLVSGATGFVGQRLANALVEDGIEVRALVRDRNRVRNLSERAEIHEGDALEPGSLAGAGEGVDVAYYLIHAMGRGARGAFGERERATASNFATMAKREGIGRVVYLGGLGEPKTPHLRSRHATAEVLAAEGPPLTYFRAGMVVGAESESFRTLLYLTRRLPVMIAPAWLRTKTQPIWIGDVLAYLRRAPEISESAGREIEIGGPDVLSYGEMLGVVARVLGKREPPMIPVPLLTPWLSSLWVGLVTPVDAGVARPLIEGLSTETIVRDPDPAKPFRIEPKPFAEAVRAAISESGEA